MKFRHHLKLTKIDPLGDGLGDMIIAEQRESDAINLADQPDGSTLEDQWNHVVDELKADPSWFDFAED